MQTGLTKKGAAARARIVAGAAEVLRTRGVAATGLTAIRAETGTSSSQLFHYFPGGKSQLMLAVAEHEAEQVLERQRPLLGDFGSRSGLRSWATDLHALLEGQGAHCALGALLSQLDASDPGVRAVVATLYATWERELQDGLLRLRVAGEIPAAVDTAAVAAVLLTGIQGGVLMMLVTGEAQHLGRALEHGLRAAGCPPLDEESAAGRP